MSTGTMKLRLTMEIGDMIRLRSYGGEEIVRRVLRLEGETVVVCREEEIAKAEIEGREPRGVGFSRRYVLGRAS